MRVRALAAGLIVLGLAVPAPVLAHEGNPNFRSEVSGAPPGVDASVLNFDDTLELDVREGTEVTVLGYEDEPYLRFLADGTVLVNERSPAAYLNDDRYADVEVPGDADPDAAPRWQEAAAQGRYGWHDHRIHYMARNTPPQVDDESVETHVFDWRVPIVVGGQREAVTGSLTWVGEDSGPSAALLGALGAAVLGSFCFAVWRLRSRSRARDTGTQEEAW
jgi:hypothetical protein